MRMEMEPLISVIVPAYNAGPYLKPCIESILSQTYRKLELILVNDGSEDDSLSVCGRYAGQDRRVTVLDQKNRGRVAARKAGVRAAKGEYLSFVDADDWIEEDMYERIIGQMRDIGKQADIVAFGLTEEYGDRQIVRKEHTGEGFYETSSLEQVKRRILCQDHFFESGMLPHLCDKLLKKESLSISGFMELDDRLVYGEDAAATFRICLKCHSLQVLDLAPYHYRQHHYTNGFRTLQVPKDNFRTLYQEFQKSIGECPDRGAYARQIHHYFWFVLLLRQFEALQTGKSLFPYPQDVLGKKVLLYGGGGFGIEVYQYIRKSGCCEIVGWTDREHGARDKQGLPLEPLDVIFQKEYDYILITILNERVAESVRDELSQSGVSLENILYVGARCLESEALPGWLTRADERR